MTDKTLYEECVDVGLKIDHHESDLYIKDCPEARTLLVKYNKPIQTFIDNIDHELWLDVPWAYQPYYDKKAKTRAFIDENI
jgi:hypothetical protein